MMPSFAQANAAVTAAAERNGIVTRNRLFVTGRNAVGQERDVDIGLSDEQGLQGRMLQGSMAERLLTGGRLKAELNPVNGRA